MKFRQLTARNVQKNIKILLKGSKIHYICFENSCLMLCATTSTRCSLKMVIREDKFKQFSKKYKGMT